MIDAIGAGSQERRVRITIARAVSLLVFVIGCSEEGTEGTGGAGGEAGSGSTSSSSSGTGGAGAGGGAPSSDPASLAFRMLTGRFDSSAQAEREPAYFAIQLETCPVDAPDLGERVLYVEQARLDQLDAPYRQRLYVVDPGADPAKDVISAVFELVDPDSFINQCADPTPRMVAASEATPREGCAVFLELDGSRFAGGTSGEECLSTLNGASYATSEVTLTETLLESWDRGYDAADMQVWGAVSGPYRFDRKTPLPSP